MAPATTAAPAPMAFPAPPVAWDCVAAAAVEDVFGLLVGIAAVVRVDARDVAESSLETSSSKDVETGVSTGRLEARGVAEGVMTAVCRTRVTEREY